jgi:arylsulfatase A-like enzyme
VLPTVLAAAGVDPRPEWKLDGVNLLPYLSGKRLEGPLLVADTANPDLSGAQLFNLANDVGEQHDLAATNTRKVKELTDDWLRWNQEMAKPLWGPGAGGRGRGGE